MRRMLVVVALAVGAVLAVPGGAAAQGPPGDSVTGTGTAPFWGEFAVDVSSGPSGENPTGQASFQAAVGPLSGPVSCLAVVDNVATFNIPGTSFGLITFEVTDNAGSGLADVIEGIPTGRVPSDCSPLSGGVIESILSGDLVVVDAPPLPTSKDQCKKGGWRNFPDFKNQGQCVAFVQRGAKA